MSQELRNLNRILVVIAISLFAASSTSFLFSLTMSYPQRTAYPLETYEYDTTFWDLSEALTLPLDVQTTSTETVPVQFEGESVNVVDSRITYHSEFYHGQEIRISCILLYRENASEPAPSVLFLHSYGSQASDFLPMMWDFAADGYVVLAIDAPGCGDSTGPLLNPVTFLNVTDGPTSAHLYHSVWAAARALTLLESMPLVNPNSSVVLGASMGGMETFILSAIDARVECSVPIISAGNLRNALQSGCFLNTLIDSKYSIGSTEMTGIIKWFDPLPYARLLTEPVFLLFGTNDEFFPLVCSMDTIAAITAPLTLSISPNSGHNLLPERGQIIREWIQSTLGGGGPLPTLTTEHTELITAAGNIIRVHVDSLGMPQLFLHWRSSEPGASWLVQSMVQTGSEYIADIVPYTHSTVLFFVSTSDGLQPGYASVIGTSTGGSIIVPVAALASIVLLAWLVLSNAWRPTPVLLKQQIPILVGLVMIAAGFTLPFFGISGRTEMSLFGFVEVYGVLYRLSGWFLPSVFGMICLIVGLSAFRLSLPVQLTVLLWLPLMAIFAVLYLLYGGFFALFGTFGLMYDSLGVYVLFLSVPVLTILESYIRREPANVLIDQGGLEEAESLVFEGEQ